MNEIKSQFEHELLSCTNLKQLEQVKNTFLGRKGLIQEQMQSLRMVSPEKRKEVGAEINRLKTDIEEKISLFQDRFEREEMAAKLVKEAIDVTLPGRVPSLGSLHPVSDSIDKFLSIFKGLGFSVQVSPNIDTEYYNFDSLNFAEDHPAKDMQDTFYLEPGVLLRTHTTNTWGHILTQAVPPVRIVCPGKCFRSEDISMRSHVFFHQIDGMYIDKGVSMQDLVWTLKHFLTMFYEQEIELRFRPSYFPFVEPGVEVDVRCVMCQGKGCPICKHTGWLEVLGAGMIHPQVLRNFGIDPEVYSGFAWGMGIERTTMLSHGVRDLRLFTQNDMRLLKQLSSV